MQGGVEKHCEELYPRMVSHDSQITVCNRAPYFAKDSRLPVYNGVRCVYLWCPRTKSLEAALHTFAASLLCIVKRPDIVHIHNIGPALCIPLLKAFGIKTVVTYHSVNYTHAKWNMLQRQILQIGEAMSIRCANKVIVVSETMRRQLEKKYSSNDLLYIPNGVAVAPAVVSGDTLQKYGLTPGGYVLAVCRLSPEKGAADLIDAYARLGRVPYKLVIAGDADHETGYSRAVKKMAAETPGVVLTGFLREEQLRVFYAHAGLFVLPSHAEGLSIALLEALSFGLPVLASDIPQNREVLSGDARFFKVGDVAQLTEKISACMARGISAEEKAQQIQYVRKRFNWDGIAEQTLAAYQRVLHAA